MAIQQATRKAITRATTAVALVVALHQAARHEPARVELASRVVATAKV